MEPDPGFAFSDSHSYDVDGFLKDLERAVNWMANLSGARGGPGRFVSNQKTIHRWHSAKGSGIEDILLVSTAVAEAIELVTIWQSLRELKTPCLPGKLKIYASGPALERDELLASASNASSDIGFELSILARLVRAGLPARLTPSADILLEEEGAEIVFECKRPQSESSVTRAIATGLRQLKLRRAEEYLGRKFVGVLALSIGKATHQGERLLQTWDAEGFNRVTDEALFRFGRIYEQTWSSDRHAKYCQLVLIMLSTPVLDEGRRLLRGAFAFHVHRRLMPKREQFERQLRIRKKLLKMARPDD